jgi:hypothetical protein
MRVSASEPVNTTLAPVDANGLLVVVKAPRAPNAGTGRGDAVVLGTVPGVSV